MADPAPIDSPFAGLQGLFDKIVGSRTVGTDTQSLNTQQTLQNLVNAITNQQQTQTGTTQQTTTGTADTGALQQILEQQQAGITPDMLKAIFVQGAKQVPGLVSTTANAIGARPGDNSPLASVLTDLNTNLTSQAANLNTQLLQQAGQTAGTIAGLTKGSTTSGTTSQDLQNLVNAITNQNQTSGTTQTKRDDTVQNVGINTAQTGAAAGIAGLVSLLGGGGLSNIPGVSGLLNTLGGGSGGQATGGTGVASPYDPLAGTGSTSGDPLNPGGLPVGTGDYGANPYTPPTPPPEEDTTPGSDAGGFADGGVVPTPGMLQLSDSKLATPPTLRDLLSMTGIGGGTGTSGGTASTGGGGADINTLLGMGGGAGTGDTGSGTGGTTGASSSTGLSGLNIGMPTAQQAITLAAAVATGNPIAIGAALAHMAVSAAQSGGTSGGGTSASSSGATGSVSAGPATAADTATGESVGVSGAMGEGTSTSTSTSTGDDGDGTGGGSGSDAGGTGAAGTGSGSGDSGDSGGGWADGGAIPYRANDPQGIMDKMFVPVSGGEFVVPKDVVDVVGVKQFQALINMFHTPAAIQRNQSLNRVEESNDVGP